MNVKDDGQRRLGGCVVGLLGIAAIGLTTFVVPPHPVFAKNEDARDAVYEKTIRPLLSRCIECHGPSRQESGLRLDSPLGIRRGGDRGPVLVVGKPAESLLVKAVKGDGEFERMPPEQKPLQAPEIAALSGWIMQGAPMPEEAEQRDVRADHWAFQRPVRPSPPLVRDVQWPRNAIDRFILARLEQQDVKPSPEADRETLIRRLSFDLTGLPPTAEQVHEFVFDPRPDAYERLVDRCLASPAYGERWGRHWLDLARYADSNGYTRDFGREMWKYRDWVIRSLNADLPFDRFTIEQFAGDLLPNATLDQIVATGFHRNTLINEEGGTDPEQFRVEAVADRVATTGSVYLGLTLGCARCHQHKYDPISQREYYQLFAFLNQCDEPTIDAPSPWQVDAGWLDLRAEIRGKIKALEAELSERKDALEQARLAWEKAVTPEFRATLPGPVQAALDLAPDKRDEAQQKLVEQQFKVSDAGKTAFPQLAEIARLKLREPRIPTTMVLRRAKVERTTHVHKRGNFLEPGVAVEPGVPAVLHALPDGDGPNRLALARWLVDPANPLTPRVVVNRHWQRFFGRGLVDTENDFGLQGDQPTHPELLDWLAVEWVSRDWSVKSLHRLVVTSATYRQTSHARPELKDRDPNNQLLARQQRIRLEAEIIRDAALACSGLLTRRIGGPSVNPPQPDGVFQFTQDPKPWETEVGTDRYRRGMYTWFWRSSPYPALTVFDFPNSNVTCTRRVRSNTPLQSLTLANDLTFLECARALAGRVLEVSDVGDDERIRRAFSLSLSRTPSEVETRRLLRFLQSQRNAYRDAPAAATELVGEDHADLGVGDVELAAWTALARVLLNVDEFITRE